MLMLRILLTTQNCINIQPKTLLKAFKSRTAPGTNLSSLLIEVTWAAFIRFGRSYRMNGPKRCEGRLNLNQKHCTISITKGLKVKKGNKKAIELRLQFRMDSPSVD